MGWLPLASVSSWTPALLPGLVAWYKSTNGVYVDAGVTLATNGQTVQQWNDQSGLNNHLKQVTGGNRPTYQAAGFNSLSTVTLSSGTWMATTADSVAMGSGLVGSAFAVGQSTVFGSNVRAISYVENGQTSDGVSNHSAAWLLNSSGTTFASYRNGFFANDSSFSLNTNLRFGNIYDNTNDTNYVNNVAGTPVAATGLTWTSPGTILIGTASTTSPANFWSGPLSEIVITNTALSSGDRLNLDNYFKIKWNL